MRSYDAHLSLLDFGRYTRWFGQTLTTKRIVFHLQKQPLWYLKDITLKPLIHDRKPLFGFGMIGGEGSTARGSDGKWRTLDGR